MFKLLSLAVVMRIVINRFIRWRRSEIILFLLLSVYGILHLRKYIGGMFSLFLYICSMATMCESWHQLRDKELFEKTMFFFVCMGLSAGLYGLLNINSRIVIQNGITLNRFCGTSADPNVMGSKWVVCLIGVIFSSYIYKRNIKALLTIVIFVFILLTGSTTAIIACVVIILIYVKSIKISRRSFFLLLIISLIVIVLIIEFENILHLLSQHNIIGPNAQRILIQIAAAKAGDISTFSSLRTEIWKGYVDYYFNSQGIIKQLIGGNVSNIYGIEKNFANMSWIAAAHNTIIDVLMCIGLIGLINISGLFCYRLKEYIFSFKAHRDNQMLMRITIKAVVMVYAFSISFFPSYCLMTLWLI